MTKNKQKVGRFLSLVLRHDPASIGLKLDSQGWAKIDDLLAGLKKNSKILSRDGLQTIVEQSKQRFFFSEDGDSIRASQGHSVDIDIKLTAESPPELLYHSTCSRFMDSIESKGLSKMSRQHVQLCGDVRIAHEVGRKHRKPIILEIAARLMESHRFQFFKSEDGVWLTETVPPDYLNGQITF
jgi:putative RNA 2'-phosphotransferase